MKHIEHFTIRNCKFVFAIISLLFIFAFTPIYSQVIRLNAEFGYINNKWEDVSLVDKLQTKNHSGSILSLHAPIIEVIENYLYFGTGLKLAKRGSDVTGPFYEETFPLYTHEIAYTSLDIPIFYELRYPIKKYRYHYNMGVLDKIVASAKIGTNFSFLASSRTLVYNDNGDLIHSGKAIRKYSQKINDLLHHIHFSLGAEYYFTDNLGISLTYSHDRSRALTKSFNHPVFNKSIYYEPVNTRFNEKANMITIGGIYRFVM